MAKLVLVQGTGESGKQYSLEGQEVVFGRQPDVDFQLNAREVSRRHARIFNENHEFYLEDLGSSNGTYLNSTKLQGRTPLHEQDQIRIGPYLFRFENTKSIETDVVIRASMPAHTSNLNLYKQDAARKLQVVLEIAQALGGSLDLQEILPKLLDQLLQLFLQADRGLVLMVEGDNLVVRALKMRRGDGSTGPTYSRSVVRRAMEEGNGIVADDVSSDQRFVTQTLSTLGIRSFICVPLKTHDGKTLGVIQLDRFGVGVPFTQEDLQLLTAISLQVTVVLDNAQMHAALLEQVRMKRDLALAREIQEGFLPHELPVLKSGRFDLFARVFPAQEVSGDFYDFFPLDDRRLAFCIADVSGKGMPAALFMTCTRTLCRHVAQRADSPSVVLQQLNDALAEDNSTGMFVTMILGFADVTTGEIVIANAGHTVPLLRQQKGEVTPLELPPGRLVGFVPGKIPVIDKHLRLEPSDALVFYTDGVTEAVGPDKKTMFGIERLQTSIADMESHLTLEAWGNLIRTAVDRFSTTRELRDDITLLLLRRPS